MSSIKPGRVLSNDEIIAQLKDAQIMARIKLRLDRRSIDAIGAAVERMRYMERRIEDLEERIDIMAADMQDDFKQHSGLISDD